MISKTKISNGTPTITSDVNYILSLVVTIVNPANTDYPGFSERLECTRLISGLTQTYDSNSNTLTIAGPALLSEYVTIIQNIEYITTAALPGALPDRELSVYITDAINKSNIEPILILNPN